MTEKINDYFNVGLVIPIFEAERNLFIWKYIADEITFIETQSKEVKSLYSYLQRCAQINFVLLLGKVFDTKKQYETRCIKSFLELLEKNTDKSIEIVETINTKNVLKEFNCGTELINSVDNSDTTLFPKLFTKYYLKKYSDPELQKDISTLKIVRDKFIAHNEVHEPQNFELAVAERLVNFTTEIISTFGMAYHSTGWKTENISRLTEDAKRNAFFVKASIDRLKNLRTTSNH